MLCGASVNVLQIVFVTFHLKVLQNERDFSDFQGGQIVGAHLAGASAAKMVILLSVSRAAVAKVMMTHKSWEEFIS